jgi:spore maturation protein SpmA
MRTTTGIVRHRIQLRTVMALHGGLVRIGEVAGVYSVYHPARRNT